MFVIVLDPTNSSQSDNLPQLTINILDKYTEFRSTILNQPVRMGLLSGSGIKLRSSLLSKETP